MINEDYKACKTMYPKINMRTEIANAICKEYWNNTATVVQRIRYNGEDNAIRVKYKKNFDMIKVLQKHMGKATVQLVDEHINPYQIVDGVLDEENGSYWIYVIKCIDWELLSEDNGYLDDVDKTINVNIEYHHKKKTNRNIETLKYD